MHEPLPGTMMAGVIVPVVLLAVNREDQGHAFLITALVCTILTAIPPSNRKSWKTRAAECVVLIYLLAQGQGKPWYKAHNAGSMALLALLAAVTIYEEIHESSAKKAARVRKLYYVISLALSSLTLAWYAFELVNVMTRMDYTPSDTTTMNCTLPDDTDSILFKSNTSYDNCPTVLWKYARVNIILMTQLYVLYLLTTTLKYDARSDNATPYLLLFVFVECGLLTVAALWQFDVIRNCHDIKMETLLLVLGAGVLRMVREYRTHRGHSRVNVRRISTVTQQSSAAELSADELSLKPPPWGKTPWAMNHVKIKL